MTILNIILTINNKNNQINLLLIFKLLCQLF